MGQSFVVERQSDRVADTMGREQVNTAKPIEVLDDLDGDLDRIELWIAALRCFQQSAPEYQPEIVKDDRVANVMRERREEVIAPKPIEVFDNLHDDLNRIEVWTVALRCFQKPAPPYQPDNVITDDGTVRSMLNKANDRTSEIADSLKSASKDLYGQARDNASQVVDAAGRRKLARNTPSSVRDVVRNAVENQPYTAIAIALGLGWLLGRMHRSL